MSSENCVLEALKELVNLTKEDSMEVDSAEKKSIIKAMKDYIHNGAIQIAACNTLNNLVMTGIFSCYWFYLPYGLNRISITSGKLFINHYAPNRMQNIHRNLDNYSYLI